MQTKKESLSNQTFFFYGVEAIATTEWNLRLILDSSRKDKFLTKKSLAKASVWILGNLKLLNSLEICYIIVWRLARTDSG